MTIGMDYLFDKNTTVNKSWICLEGTSQSCAYLGPQQLNQENRFVNHWN